MSHGINSRTIVFTGAKSAATMCEPCGVRTTVAPSNVSCPQKGVSLPRVARSTTVAFGNTFRSVAIEALALRRCRFLRPSGEGEVPPRARWTMVAFAAGGGGASFFLQDAYARRFNSLAAAPMPKFLPWPPLPLKVFVVRQSPAGARPLTSFVPGKTARNPWAGTVYRGGVLCATKTLPSTDYKGSGWPEIVVEIRGPTTSRLLQPGGRGSPGATYYTLFWGLPTLPSTSWGRSQAMTRSKDQ